MDGHAIRLLTQAAHHGATVIIHDNTVRIRGITNLPDELRHELHTHAQRIRRIVTADHCAACFTRTWIHEANTHIPWCRPHANRRGEQLLRHEHPNLLDTRTN